MHPQISFFFGRGVYQQVLFFYASSDKGSPIVSSEELHFLNPKNEKKRLADMKVMLPFNFLTILYMHLNVF